MWSMIIDPTDDADPDPRSGSENTRLNDPDPRIFTFQIRIRCFPDPSTISQKNALFDILEKATNIR